MTIFDAFWKMVLANVGVWFAILSIAIGLFAVLKVLSWVFWKVAQEIEGED